MRAFLHERLHAPSFGSVVRKYCLLGPREACRTQMQHHVDAEVRHFVIAPLVDAALVTEGLAGTLTHGLSVGPR